MNVHFHAVLPDGVFTRREDGRITFVALDAPTHEDVVSLTQKVTRRVLEVLDRPVRVPADSPELEIRCAPGNLRSRAIPERRGFTREGQSRDVGWLYNHCVYVMIASDWKSSSELKIDAVKFTA